MMQFKKYTTLPSELRSHVVSYHDNEALANYALCSKLCNEEVQRSHICFPKSIKIEDRVFTTNSDPPTHFNRVGVTMRYPEREMRYQVKFQSVHGNQHRIGTGKSSRYRYQDDAHQAAIEYIKNRLKYARIGNPVNLTVDMKEWPTDLLNIPGIDKYDEWNIEIYESMCHKFYEWAANHPIRNKHLTLSEFYTNNFTIPAQFYETDFFQNLEHFRHIVPYLSYRSEGLSMSVNSFLTMKATTIDINISAFPLPVINQKIAQWFANPASPLLYYTFRDRTRNLRSSIDEILRNLPVTNSDDSRGVKSFGLDHENGCTGLIQLHKDALTFTTFSD